MLIRFILSLLLVLSTWNPTGYCYVDWFLAHFPAISAEVAFVGVVLLIGWALFLNATLAALGFFGILLATAFFGTLTWVLFDQGLITAKSDVVTWVTLVVLAGILALGMSWGNVWRKLSGQVEVREDHHH